ncbi:pectinesterase family protein [Streptomyces sp. NBC_00576]|uniref:pectinesterase family protein n=1 Tax=Streptomyces sp. NBC_00576 TaxID=2903665 RepID=UPI002E81A590|nr:pectinesterase family protein [Streptomyces sp. NBC_00576]WUB76556.1 pectinesterase family protein [Streptomyces sp. NBC_00576]
MSDGLSRRSFLAAATAVSLAAAGAVVLADAPSASAATGADITWRITSETGKGDDGAAKTYAGLLHAIRDRIRSHEVRPDGGRTVDVTDQDGTSTYITVDLHGENMPQFIRVVMRRSDAYVMGWFSGVENGVGDVRIGDFFPLERGLVNGQGGIPQGRPANPNATPPDLGSQTNTRFNTLAGYDALRGQNATRDQMEINPASLATAVRELANGASIGVRDAAQSILQIIVGIAEAARFRNQAAATVTAFQYGRSYVVTPAHVEQHNNWSVLSVALLTAVVAGTTAVAFGAPLVIGGITYLAAYEIAANLMLAHHSNKGTRGRGALEGTSFLVANDGTGDYWTVQEAIDHIPSSGANTVFIDTGVYHEVITVASNKSWLTIQGVSGKAQDVIIYNTRAHGMLQPDYSTQWGTEGSAVATFKSTNLTVKDLTVSNTFDPATHPEISPYETQAVAIAAKGDRQVYDNVRILGHQDTLLVKSPTATAQTRQYFYNCFIQGNVDFIFGNATAVIDRSTIQQTYWPGGTVLAPNTDKSKKYGILITGCSIPGDGQAPIRSMYLGRPWHNSVDAWPQAVVRDTVVYPQVNDTHPWTYMTTDYSWTQARFFEYNNSGLGAGVQNAPKLTAAQAADYTAQKYLAGTDGWNPVR